MPYYTGYRWNESPQRSQGPCSLRRTASCSLALFANFAPWLLGTAGKLLGNRWELQPGHLEICSILATIMFSSKIHKIGFSNQSVYGPFTRMLESQQHTVTNLLFIPTIQNGSKR